jgi:hypothetical protein
MRPNDSKIDGITSNYQFINLAQHVLLQFVKNPIDNTDMDSSYTVDEMVMSDEPLKSKRIRKPVNKLDY